ncbi:MAG TPA: DNA repair protein RecO [Bacillota bacterium]|nr:DNA repair protein RecO [Bacillota bacterium]HPT36063.1 DNA repair protein RecO [Bacillota bacterium]
MLYQSEAVVLDQDDLGENDKLATIFTRQEGLVRAVVKGARRPRSKLRGLTQPLTHGVFQIYRGRNLDRVTQVAVKNGFPGIVENYEKMIYARYLVELLTSVLPEKERHPALFDFFLTVLGCLQDKHDPWVVVRWAELGILKLAGFAPSFSQCVECGSQLQEPPVYFSLRDGGGLCGSCVSAAPATSASPENQIRTYGGLIRVSPGALRTLEILSAPVTGWGHVSCPNITARGQVRSEINRISRKYISFVLDKRLKSASLVESIEDET